MLALALGVPALLHTARGREPPPPAAPTPAARSRRRQATQPIVVSVAAGARWAYALVAECGTRILHDCDYRVFRRDLIDSGLGSRRRCTSPAATTTGLDVTMRVTPDDHVLLVGRHQPAGLRRRRRHRAQPAPAAPGPPVAALPPDAVLASELCPTCADAVTAVDLATGELRPLRSQPAFTGFGLRLARVDGDVLWVAQVGPGGGLTAVSADRGRTWRTIPLAAGMVLTDPVVLASIPGGGAYLVGRRPNDLPGRAPDRRAGRQLAPDHPGRTARTRRTRPWSTPAAWWSGTATGRPGGSGRTTSSPRCPGTPGYLSGSRVLLGLPSTPGTVELSYDGGHDLAVGAAGLTNRGARGLGGRPGHRGRLARRESWVKRAANRRGHAGVAGDRSNAGTAVVSRRGR